MRAPGGRRRGRALLKQADSSQKKVTLTRLSSAPVPFTVLSLVSNPCNENFLAVCGLKVCYVLSFNSRGWCCSRRQRAPTTSSRWCGCRAHGGRGHIHAADVLRGPHLFPAAERRVEGAARHIMELPHPDIKDSGGSLAGGGGGGGVSIYYNHTMQMLFCSYAQG